MRKIHYPWICLIFTALSCCQSSDEQDLIVEGYVPIYATTLSQGEIELTEAQSVKNPGKIYIYDHYLLINEVNKGIHVYDNSTPELPVPLGFIALPGNREMAIRNNVLYADAMGELLAISITDFSTLIELGRLPIANWLLGIPAPAQSYFECIDASKGFVIEWKKQELKNPDCYAH